MTGRLKSAVAAVQHCDDTVTLRFSRGFTCKRVGGCGGGGVAMMVSRLVGNGSSVVLSSIRIRLCKSRDTLNIMQIVSATHRPSNPTFFRSLLLLLPPLPYSPTQSHGHLSVLVFEHTVRSCPETLCYVKI